MGKSEVWVSGWVWVEDVEVKVGGRVMAPEVEGDGRTVLVEGVCWSVGGSSGCDEDVGITGFAVETIGTGACTWEAVKLPSPVVKGATVETEFRLPLDVVVVVVVVVAAVVDVPRAAF